MKGLSIGVRWLDGSDGPEEIRQTAAEIRIGVGDHVATRIDDLWSRSVKSEIRVSAYPLALWIASSWWRLLTEPRRSRAAQDLSWRMSHELPAAGGGFLWPPLTFEADGEVISFHCHPSPPREGESAQFLSEFHENVLPGEFEKAVDEFVRIVVARLDASGVTATPLHALWDDLCEERRSASLAKHRELEARLGYDPDQAPADLMDRMQALAGSAGHGAIGEIAPVCAGGDPKTVLSAIERFSQSAGIEAVGAPREPEGRLLLPWQRGKTLAHKLRQTWGLRDEVSGHKLADILGVSPKLFEEHSDHGVRPLGLAVRNGQPGHLKLLFRWRRPTAIRFEAARFLAGHLTTPLSESWIPVTDALTSRQKLQRAFAAEFLCPIGPLQEVLGGDFSEESIGNAADHFGVSEHTVEYQLRNHDMVPWDRTI